MKIKVVQVILHHGLILLDNKGRVWERAIVSTEKVYSLNRSNSWDEHKYDWVIINTPDEPKKKSK